MCRSSKTLFSFSIIVIALTGCNSKSTPDNYYKKLMKDITINGKMQRRLAGYELYLKNGEIITLNDDHLKSVAFAFNSKEGSASLFDEYRDGHHILISNIVYFDPKKGKTEFRVECDGIELVSNGQFTVDEEFYPDLTPTKPYENSPKAKSFMEGIIQQAANKAGGKEKVTKLSIWKPNMAQVPRVSDISPLADFVAVKDLFLEDHKIIFLDPLSKMTNLEKLNLEKNFVTDLTPLAGMTKMVELNLTRNNLNDLSPLKNMAKMKYLNLSSNFRITDLSPLSEMTEMERLAISFNSQISDLSPLSKMTKMKDLFFQMNNQIKDLTPLEGMPELELLVLGKIDKKEVDKLQKVLPKCKITFQAK